jgi:hypothetical protein
MASFSIDHWVAKARHSVGRLLGWFPPWNFCLNFLALLEGIHDTKKQCAQRFRHENIETGNKDIFGFGSVQNKEVCLAKT